MPPIPSFHAHQHINPRETASQLPTPDIDASTTRQPRVSDKSPRDSDAQGGREGKGREGKARPDDVSEQVWGDYIAHRKAKKSTVSSTVIDSMRVDAKTVGLTLEQAMQMQIKRGWTGFDPSWVSAANQPVSIMRGVI